MLIASLWLLDNSGTPGLCALLIELISNESAEQSLRHSAAANLYSLIQRSWSPEVCFIFVDEGIGVDTGANALSKSFSGFCERFELQPMVNGI